MFNTVNESQTISNSLIRRLKINIRFLPKLLKLYKLQKMIINYLNAKAVFAFAKLSIADSLTSGKTCETIANERNLNVNALAYLLQLLTRLKYVKADKNGVYTLTALGERFKLGAPNSIRSTVLSMTNLIGPAWDSLTYSIETGQSGFKQEFQEDFYEYININKQAHSDFTGWMAETIREWVIPALDYLDFSHISKVIDIGGNTGILMLMLLQKYPTLEGIIFDRGYMEETAKSNILNSNLQNRCHFLSGDFFEAIPSGGDLYILSRVLDNWDDERALKILKNCSSVMSPSSRLIIIDTIHDKKSNELALLGHLHVLVMGEGVIRNRREYSDLLRQAGLKVLHIVNFGGPIGFIEVKRMF